jgi:type 1 glutamine amidotransferase
MKKWLCALVVSMAWIQAAGAMAAMHIKVLLLDGESGGSYHNWKAETPILKMELEETGLFDVDVLTAPAAGGDFSQFHPEWTKYQVVVFNYDAPDDRWSSEVKGSFEQYIKEGGGMVTAHAADNAFPKWQAYNEMTGIGGWRGRTEVAGPYWYYKDGKLVSDDKPGRAGNHGLRVPFQVTVRDATHPIMRGLPKMWMHQGDELYSRLRGPGKMTVLATAYSDPANRGTGFDEPQLMVSQWVKGRIFHTTFGHDVMALSSVDYVVTFQRGTEWAATGKVTQAVPAGFPTANSVSYRTDIAVKDPNALKGMNVFDTPSPPRPTGGSGGAIPLTGAPPPPTGGPMPHAGPPPR